MLDLYSSYPTTKTEIEQEVVDYAFMHVLLLYTSRSNLSRCTLKYVEMLSFATNVAAAKCKDLGVGSVLPYRADPRSTYAVDFLAILLLANRRNVFNELFE